MPHVLAASRRRLGLPALVFALALACWIPATPAVAQDAAESDSVHAWTYNLTGKLSGSQAAYKDWQEGGINSISLATGLDGTAEKRGERWAQTHELRLTFGFIDQDEQELRKSEDLIRFGSNFRYQGRHFFRLFNPTIAAKVRTQFAKGFQFSGDNPFPEGHPYANDPLPVQTSAFFSPAFITETVGLTYDRQEWYSLRLGAASKQTVVLDDSLRTLYDVSEDKVARVEVGAEFVASLTRQIAENVRYKSTFSAFYSYEERDNPPDVIWENVVTMKVNNWLSTDFEFVAMYDKNTVDTIQMKEVLSVGISFVLI